MHKLHNFQLKQVAPHPTTHTHTNTHTHTSKKRQHEQRVSSSILTSCKAQRVTSGQMRWMKRPMTHLLIRQSVIPSIPTQRKGFLGDALFIDHMNDHSISCVDVSFCCWGEHIFDQCDSLGLGQRHLFRTLLVLHANLSTGGKKRFGHQTTEHTPKLNCEMKHSI